MAVPCGECHKADVLSPNPSTALYRFKDLSCTTCHADPHRGEFAERMKAKRADGSPWGCEACHNTSAWPEKLKFDHSTTPFLLTGAHRAVACINCHKPPNLEVTMKNVVFNSAPLKCEGCHADPHARQFAHDGKDPACESCHNTARWKPPLFDHETRTDFSLKGGHVDVPCHDCHKLTREVQNNPVLFFKPTPHQCSACHGAAIPQPKKPS